MTETDLAALQAIVERYGYSGTVEGLIKTLPPEGQRHPSADKLAAKLDELAGWITGDFNIW